MNIKEVKSSEDAVVVAREELKRIGENPDLSVLHVMKFGPKDTSLKTEGWWVIFALDMPGFEPDMRVEIYPSLGLARVPDIL